MAFSALPRLPRIEKRFAIKISDNILSLSKFWIYFVNVKIVKIWHSNGSISYKKQYHKNVFFVKMFTTMLFHMYQVFSFLLGHLPFSVHFLLHFNGITFFGTPNIVLNVPSFQLFARSSSFFRAFFFHFYGTTFYESPHT